MHLLPVHPMHIPDGFLSTTVSLVLWVISVVVVGISLRRVRENLAERQVPLMGMLAAAIFAGQMLNFAVAGGTSGHLMGAAIATILLGPWAAVIVMTCVVGVQALIFQDGGLLALGANIMNMGIIAVLVSHFAYRLLRKISGDASWGILAGGFLAAWLSVEVSSLATALQISISGTSPASLSIPAMGGVHALIGIGEGLITVGTLAFLYRVRRDLLQVSGSPSRNEKWIWISGLILALVLIVVSPLASTHPDGLEWVAEKVGFLHAAREPLFSIIPDYILPGVSNETLATIAAGVIGLLIVTGVVAGLMFKRRRRGGSGQP